jgi:HSP20 family protein
MPMRRGSGQHWIPSIFNDFFDNNWMVRTNATAPAINVLENEKEYTVEVAAPGMTKSDFKIQVDTDNDLTITMEKRCSCNCGKEEKKDDQQTANAAPSDEAKGRYLRREFSYTKFQQTLVLPEDIEPTKIEAKVSDGVLCIKIPKKSHPETKNICHNIAIS